jgi:sortase A
MRKPLAVQLSNVFLAAGAVLLVCAIGAYARTSIRQAELMAAWEEELPILPAPALDSPDQAQRAGGVAASSDTIVRFREGDPVARLRIPELDVDAVVLEGVSKATLAVAPGHYPGMAFPGEGGHAVLSAHRDSFFKRLGELEIGDRISLTRWDGREVSYDVARSFIVHKGNRTIIVPRDEEVLTLITCYPFVYAGAAPYRYIVEARPADS